MRFLRFLFGLALLPLCWAATRALVVTLQELPAATTLISPESLSLAAGYAVWLLVYFLLPVPARTYIWAHELTHALWAVMSGAKVHRIRVGADRGYVEMSHTTPLITLAPYFFPLYTILVIIVRLALGLFVDLEAWRHQWLFLVGLTWGFHLTFTLRSLSQRQSDIAENGRVFSYALIYFLNLLGLGLWVVATTPATFFGFAVQLVEQVLHAYASSFTWFQHLAQALINGLRALADRFRPPDIGEIVA